MAMGFLSSDVYQRYKVNSNVAEKCAFGRLHDESFPLITWSKFSLTKCFDRVNLHQKLCQRTLKE